MHDDRPTEQRATTWLRLACVALALCGCGTSGTADPAPDAAHVDDAASDAFSLDLGEASLDPVDAAPDPPDATAPADVTAASDVAAPDATPPRDAPVDVGAPDASGCEGSSCGGRCVTHGESPNLCGTAVDLGSFCGDQNCNAPLCRATMYRAVVTRTGLTSQWFRARAVECSVCSGSLVARVTLTVPAGVDYDLFVHRPCGTIVGRSIRNAGEPDQVEITQTDGRASDDGFDYVIEVRHVSGASCTPWSLQLETRGADATNC